MICESGYFEYDQNLEKYIDCKRYGEDKAEEEKGVFTSRGYIIYHGCNQKLSKMLLKNLGMVIPEQKELITLKLYMPLVVNYDAEYVEDYEIKDPKEIPSSELMDNMDGIADVIEEDEIFKEERGLMRYYDKYDSINAKVLKYVFSIEAVGEELLGVAILTLYDNLTTPELEKIKKDIRVQASDGEKDLNKELLIRIWEKLILVFSIIARTGFLKRSKKWD